MQGSKAALKIDSCLPSKDNYLGNSTNFPVQFQSLCLLDAKLCCVYEGYEHQTGPCIRNREKAFDSV